MNLSKISEITAGKIRTNGVSPFSDLEISKVYPNPQQPRKKFDDIEELAYTIKEHGLLQPITVVKREDGYMIISGERRYKAHLHNKAKTIKAHIIEASEYQIKEMALIENIQRNDLTDFEKAKFISILWTSGNYKTKTDLAMTIGKSSSYISKAFGCLKLDETILKDLEENVNEVPLSVLEEISRVKNKDMQIDAYNKYVNGQITRNNIKEFKPKKNIKEKVEGFKNPPISCSYTEEKQKFVSYGRGVLNEIGLHISVGNGDLEATIFMELSYKKLIKTSIINNYKITIEEI